MKVASISGVRDASRAITVSRPGWFQFSYSPPTGTPLANPSSLVALPPMLKIVIRCTPSCSVRIVSGFIKHVFNMRHPTHRKVMRCHRYHRCEIKISHAPSYAPGSDRLSRSV
jgi:hypothetical protein